MTSDKRQAGFTLVELSLAIVFLGILMSMAVAIILQVMSIYTKGLAIKQINQAGRAVVEDINRISGSGASLTVNDNGYNGYLCVETAGKQRAYMWNSKEMGQRLPQETKPLLGGNYKIGSPAKDVSVVRSNDGVDSGECSLVTSVSGKVLDSSKFTSLAGSQVRVLSVDIYSSPASPKLKKIVFWIGSDGLDIYDIVWVDATNHSKGVKSWTCKGSSLGDYCAVSKFETVVYTPNVTE